MGLNDIEAMVGPVVDPIMSRDSHFFQPLHIGKGFIAERIYTSRLGNSGRWSTKFLLFSSNGAKGFISFGSIGVSATL